MEYLQDIFYKTSYLSKTQICKLFEEAKELSFNWWVDDQPDSTRRKIDMSFEEVIRLFQRTPRKNLHIVVIHRRGYENFLQHIEIGFCTLNRSNKSQNGDIFLWIDVDLKYKQYLLKKYFKII